MIGGVIMKKYTSIKVIILLFVFGLTACLDDEGNYNYADLGNFYVDTVGIQHTYTIKQFSSFALTPKFIYDGDKSVLKYKWELYKSDEPYIGPSSYGTGYSHDYTRDDYPDYTISTERELDVKIEAIPGAYYLVFTATDTTSGLKTTMDWRLTVEGVIGSGLAVLYKNAGRSDIDIVYSPLFNGSLTETSYNRNTYSTVNPTRPLTGEPKELVSAIYASYDLYYLYMTSGEDVVRLSSIDMSIADEFDGLFAGKIPAVKDLNGIFVRNYNTFFINNGVAYKANSGGLQLTPVAMKNDDYYAVAGNTTWQVNSLFYDGLHRRFIFSKMWSAEIDPVINSAAHFDFGNVGKDLIHWSNGYWQSDNQINYCFFKNPVDDGKRYMYVFVADKSTASAYTSKCAMDISACPDIALANSFATGERGPVVFYATDANVYRMNYNVDDATSSATAVWTPAAGEVITRIEFFKNAGLNLENSTKDKYLLVATYNSSGKGKIYVIESDISSGVLGAEPVAVYEFDGRIADFDFIAQ